MSAPAATPTRPLGLSTRSLGDRLGDFTLYGLTGGAAFGALVLVALLVYELFDQAWPSIQKFGLGFVTSHAWDPVKTKFGALDFIWGTLYTSLLAVLLAAPLSIARELFLAVPDELEDGALALGLTRWEMIRGVVLPYTRGGLVAAVILGLGRAVGEAIAVTQVIGGLLGIHVSLFQSGDTLASRIAAQYQGAATNLQVASLVYLALILLLISLLTNVVAQLIVRRFEFQRTGGA